MTKMYEEIHQQPDVLKKSFKWNDALIKDIAESIRNSNINNVFIAARGTSDHAAIYGKYIFEMHTGMPVALSASSVFTIYNKRLIFKNTLVIAISQSGEAEDALAVIKEANRQGAVTVSITNSPKSILARESRFHLYCDAGIEKSVAATKTFMAQIYLLAHLTACLTEDKELEAALLNIPDKLNDMLKNTDLSKEKIQRYRFINECFVLARGVNYSIALEAALKIQETTYVRAKGYATSDFYHGPFAMIEKDFPVIVFAPDGPSFADVKKMTDRLDANGVELIVVSDNKDILNMGKCKIEIPKTNNDILSPFFNTVVAQLFACNLALIRGLDPDNPRGLKKVTITR